MCTGCFPDDIVVCPSCKRDDEAYKLGEAESPFVDYGEGRLKCLCGCIFYPEKSGHDMVSCEQAAH